MAIIKARKTRQINLGGVLIGNNAPISVQSMCNTKTKDVVNTVEQINELANAGCNIVRVAVPTTQDAQSLQKIVSLAPIPVIADIHFRSQYIFSAIDAGCAGVRVNPGNIVSLDNKIKEITKAATQAGVVLRIGVNAGSLDKEIMQKYNGVATADALVESALKEARIFDNCGFYNYKISIKHHDPLVTIEAYKKLSKKVDCPLHIGVTEAGPILQGVVKNSTAIAILLSQGIGDTLRVSLSAPPIQEVKAGLEILYSLGLKNREYEIISCPTCGRTEVDLQEIIEQVEQAVIQNNIKLKVAVMGCIVNGPGEAAAADVGVACGKGTGQLFVKGKPIKIVKAKEIVSELITLAKQYKN